MVLLTIGAFARAARLSPKALRRYDELGLLRPAHVDPHNGYRRYAPDQLEHARLVAWLRRLGMPLARIKTVCALPVAEAAEEVAAYWREVEADTEARRELAGFLVDHLSGRDMQMADPRTRLTLRYAAVTDRGLVRERNQDAAFADQGLLAVADGFGPSPDTATTAIRALATRTAGSAGALLDVLRAAARDAADAVRDNAPDDAVGTTLTALAWSDSELALVHVGDSRAYLLRDGELLQLQHMLARKLARGGRSLHSLSHMTTPSYSASSTRAS